MKSPVQAPRIVFLTVIFMSLLPWSTAAPGPGEKAGPWSIWQNNKPPDHVPPLLKVPPEWQPGTVLIPFNGPDIQVLPSANPQTEVSIAVNTANPRNLLITANTVPSTSGQGYYVSQDAGRTWTGSDFFPVSAPNYGDPVSVFDGAGTAYDVALSAFGGIIMTTSSDGGVTWTPAVNIDPLLSSSDDKEHAAADHSPGSPFLNSFYCAWTDFGVSSEPVVLVSSRDNYATRHTLDAALAGDFGQGVNLSVGPNGEVYAVWAYYVGGNLPEAGCGFARSLDGGATWSAATVPFAYQGIRVNNGPNSLFNGTRVNSFPWSAVDISSGPHRGRLYVVYTDRSLGDADIYLRYSDDRGASWSPALRVNSDPAGNAHQQWFPSVAVDPITGEVAIAYYSIDTPSTFATNYWVAHSTNGGATFETFPVSDVSHVPQELGGSFASGYAGDYYGIAAYNGRAWPAWSDNRTGTYNVYVEVVDFADPKDPRAPDNVAAVSDYSTPNSIALSWTDPTTLTDGTPLTSFEIEVRRDGAPIDTVAAGQQSLTDSGLTEGVLYTYALRTRDLTTDSLSITVAFAHFAGGDPVPGAPTALAADPTGGTIELSWNNPTLQRDGSILDDFAGVNVYRDGTLLALLNRAPGDTGAAETYVDSSPGPGINCYQLTAFDNETPVNESSPTPAACIELPLSPPISDTFPTAGAPDPGLWEVAGTVSVDGLAASPPSPPNACDFLGPCDLTSKPINLSGLQGQNYVVLYYKEQTGNAESPDPGNDLYLDFQTSDGNWDVIAFHSGSDPDESMFTRHIISLDGLVPGTGTYFHSQFRFRFRATGDPGFDNWFVDNVVLDQATCAPTAVTTPVALSDSLIAGDPRAYRQDLVLGNTCDFVSLSWSAAISPPVSWLSLAGTTGTIEGAGSATIEATFRAGVLPVGTHATEIRISSNDPVNPVLHVPVTLEVLPAPDIDVAPPALQFTSDRDGPSQTDTVVVRNTGASPLIFSVSDIPISGDQPGILPGDTGPVAGTGTITGPEDGIDPGPGGKDPEDSGSDLHQPPQQLRRGGPDAAGYSWIDSDEPGGPAFDWFDITTVGTNLNLCCSDVTRTGVPLGFSMPFYGTAYSTVNICTNGFLSFTSSSTAYSNMALPNPSAPPTLIAPFWDDLYLGITGASVYVYTDVAGRRFIVQYNNAYDYYSAGQHTFQVILEESGRILFQYLDNTTPGVSTTVGIQNSDATIGLTTAYNQTYVHDNLAVLFSQDADWITVSPSAGVVAPGDSIALAATVDPAGLSLGPHLARILIASNDLDEPTVNVDLRLDVTGVGDPLPFCDNFSTGAQPDPARWTHSGVVLDDIGLNEPSPAQSAHFDGLDQLTTVHLNLDSLDTAGLGFRYYLEKTGGGESPDPGNDLIVEFRDSDGFWNEVARHTGADLPNMDRYALNLIDIESLTPSHGSFFHALFQVRFRTTGDFGSDDWFVDDVCLDDFFCRPAVTVEPLALADTLNVGMSGPPLSLLIANTCATGLLSFSLSLSPSVSWLSLSPLSGLIPGVGTTTVNVAFNSLGLVPGDYRTTIRLASNDERQPVIFIPVDFLVAPPPRGSVWPDSLTAATWVGGPARDGTAQISSFGGGLLGWRVIDFPAAETGSQAPLPNPKKLSLFEEFTKLPDRVIEPGAVKEPLDDGNYPKGFDEPAAGPHIQPYSAGGPDAFGYRWVDSDDAFGPPFEWEEIEGQGGIDSGIRNDDQNRGPVPIGFRFPFYGALYDSMRICSNGWISPTSSAISWTNAPFPATGQPNTTIAPLWDDLAPVPGSRVYYRSDPGADRFVVEYRRFVRHNAPTDTLTFQVVLWRDGSIQFNYLFLSGLLNSATVGIENATGTVGLTVVHDQVYVHSGLTVLIYPDAPWVAAAPATGSVIPGGYQEAGVHFDPAGLSPGLYRGWLRFLTDDPRRPRHFVALRFEIDAVPREEACPDCPAAVQEVPVEAGAAHLDFRFCNCSPVAGTFRWTIDDDDGWAPARTDTVRLEPGECLLEAADYTLPPSVAAGDTNFVTFTVRPADLPERRHACRVLLPVISSPTAVELAEFTAALSPDGVEIAWLTAAEADHDYFDVLRGVASADPLFIRLNGRPLRGAGRRTFRDTDVEDGQTYLYRLEAVDRAGGRSVAGEIRVTADLRPRVVRLSRSYPNPFRHTTRFRLDLPEPGRVSLRVFDAAGRLVRVLSAGEPLPAGRHEYAWTAVDDAGRPVADGLYFLKAEGPGFTKTVRMLVMK